jgi:hypothetical protein
MAQQIVSSALIDMNHNKESQRDFRGFFNITLFCIKMIRTSKAIFLRVSLNGFSHTEDLDFEHLEDYQSIRAIMLLQFQEVVSNDKRKAQGSRFRQRLRRQAGL